VAENFGGPVWHASGKSRKQRDALAIALSGISGVGDAEVGEWRDLKGVRGGVVHVLRRLSVEEREEFSVPEPYDIRGTDEERRRIEAVYAEAPYLQGMM